MKSKNKELWDKIFLALKKCRWFDEAGLGGCSGSWTWWHMPNGLGKLNPKCIHCPKWDHG